MGFQSYVFGFNEPTFTSLAYVCYLLAFMSYSAYLMSRSSRALRAPRGRIALAGAGAGGGGTMDVTLPGGEGDLPRVTYSPLLGRISTGLVALAWASLTVAIGMRW